MKRLAFAVAFRAARALAVTANPDHWGEEEIAHYTPRSIETHPAPYAERVLEFEDMQRDVRAALHCLPLKQHFVLVARFGLFDGADLTLEEVGEILHITSERVRQLQVLALRRLSLGARGVALREHWRGLDGRSVARGHFAFFAGQHTYNGEATDTVSIAIATCEGCGRESVPVARDTIDGLTLCPVCFFEGATAEIEESELEAA